jgi:hypothetical protein
MELYAGLKQVHVGRVALSLLGFVARGKVVQARVLRSPWPVRHSWRPPHARISPWAISESKLRFSCSSHRPSARRLEDAEPPRGQRLHGKST